MKEKAMRRLYVGALLMTTMGLATTTIKAADPAPQPLPGKTPAPMQSLPAQPLPVQRPFKPKQVRTPPISMTGMRAESVTVESNEITMTGQRFIPIVVETGEVDMTGRR